MINTLQRVAHVTRINYGTFRGWVRHALAMLQWSVGSLQSATDVDLRKADRLVFVCLGNINRSCFAEGVATREGAMACSFGLSTTTGAPAFHMAVATAERLGVDLQAHQATNLTDYIARPGDLLLVMEVRHIKRLRRAGLGHVPTALLGAWTHPRRLHLHDPHKLSSDYFLTCFGLIESATRALVHEWKATRQGSTR
jgi:protein-tyrosine phosphatase